MQAIASDTSRKLANMSFLCAILVVCIHIQCPEECEFWFIKWVSAGLAMIAVPFFFAMSGYVLLNHLDDKEWWRNAMRKRIRTLVIPFFCINLVWWLVFYTVHAIGVRYFHASDTMEIWSSPIVNFLKGINILPVPGFGYPALLVLWYVRALLLLVLTAPIFVWLMRRSKRMALVVVSLIYICWMLQRQFLPWMIYELSLRCLFFFVSGMFVRLYDIDNCKPKIGICYLVVGAGLMVVNKLCMVGGLTHSVLGSSCTMFLIIGLLSVMPAFKLPGFFAGKSFAIYVLHDMLIYLGGAVFKAVGLWNAVNTDLGIVVTIIGYTILACGIADFMKRKTPKLSQLFFGGR